MQIVGNKLAEWANHETEVNVADLFGRSAFNRYYYSAFLVTRELLNELDSKWAEPSHSGIPDLLRKTIVKKVKLSINKAVKLGTIDPGEALKLEATIMTAANELANLLSAAYAVRVIADYEPEVQIIKKGKVFSLNNESITRAKNWPNQASIYTTSIRKVWKGIGLG
jgi:hypothetical protein